MPIPTELIGSIPRPNYLLEAAQNFRAGKTTQEKLDESYNQAVRETIEQLEATGSPVLSDGEQT
ncbi:5-methyltetrahydropteroyltriglutamate--homocysteine methyltransferase, partial [bacterium]|nr:5-methyltetrahydropteroyltriglutamate--homocysteine methyltransferase [bacterium]